jgi:hypothetical protein
MTVVCKLVVKGYQGYIIQVSKIRHIQTECTGHKKINNLKSGEDVSNILIKDKIQN